MCNLETTNHWLLRIRIKFKVANMTSQEKGKKVFVGLSGGVDSAVSAALLKKAGHDVTGVFIKVWQPDWIECNWKEERLEAMRAAAHLDIPFVTLDLVEEYKKGVIDYMIAEYAAGRTPNPDVMCNREVKFGAFWKWARSQGADYIATGHYARITTDHGARRKEKGEMVNISSPYFVLRTSRDSNKDQSYFLWTLNQNDLPHVLFPVGGLTKPEVRKLAVKFKLPNADKKDSQGLCFIGHVDIKEFLTHYVKAEKGNVLDEKGMVIGTHPGALLFTIGERHGFTVTKKTADDEPLYVVEKDVKENTITVATKSKIQTTKLQVNSKFTITKTNWINQVPKTGDSLKARSRYRQALQLIRIVAVDGDRATVEFTGEHEALTPGQSLVIYRGDECVGGGIIE